MICLDATRVPTVGVAQLQGQKGEVGEVCSQAEIAVRFAWLICLHQG